MLFFVSDRETRRKDGLLFLVDLSCPPYSQYPGWCMVSSHAGLTKTVSVHAGESITYPVK
jgi:hypothetical protein